MPDFVQEVPILHGKEDGIYLRNTQIKKYSYAQRWLYSNGKFINLRQSGIQQAMAAKREG